MATRTLKRFDLVSLSTDKQKEKYIAIDFTSCKVLLCAPNGEITSHNEEELDYRALVSWNTINPATYKRYASTECRLGIIHLIHKYAHDKLSNADKYATFLQEQLPGLWKEACITITHPELIKSLAPVTRPVAKPVLTAHDKAVADVMEIILRLEQRIDMLESQIETLHTEVVG